MGVCQLAYVGLGVADIDPWLPLLSDVLGMEVDTDGRTADGGGERLLCRYDHHAARLLLHRDTSDDVAFLGWQVDTPSDLDTLGDTIAATGIDVNQGSAEESKIRRVRNMVWFIDPEGLRTELCYGPLVDSNPLTPGRPHHGFVADHLGAGHVVLTALDRDRTSDFYRDALGFRLSDYGRGRLAFLRCNARHHSVALMPASMSDTPKRLVHLMLQVQSLDDVGIAFDRCLDDGVPLVTTIGKHTNDRSVSFYLQTPAGFEIEYGWGSVEVDERVWEAATYTTSAVWGHHRVDALTDALQNRKTRW
jgi:2,3-dihydroxybiphenyl 1,2-dioxygenase